ncbi:MAG: phosphatidate cytidylyltransferase [Clostridia bacterium]|nr:phosphatidate cytidylyltransferase [Clostridia bacterium]
MSEGLKRFITGVVLLGILFFFLLYLRTLAIWTVDILVMAFLGVGMFEMYRATKLQQKPIIAPLVTFFVIVYPLWWFLRDIGVLIALSLSIIEALTIFTFALTDGEDKKVQKYDLHDLGVTLLTLIYPGLFVAMFMSVNYHAGDLLAILMMLIVPLMDDACAYFVGSKFGKHKLIPAISPKKSVEGLFGGIAGGILAQAIIFLLFEVFGVFSGWNNVLVPSISDKLYVSIPIYMVLALILVAADFAGDLVASRIKRIVGIKDYGKIFPGHGGVMDRLDSLIFAMPVVYVFFTFCREFGLLYQ